MFLTDEIEFHFDGRYLFTAPVRAAYDSVTGERQELYVGQLDDKLSDIWTELPAGGSQIGDDAVNGWMRQQIDRVFPAYVLPDKAGRAADHYRATLSDPVGA